MSLTEHHIKLNDAYGAKNYKPLPVVLARGRGEWLWDVEGRRYLDMLSAYSAVNQGHCHPRMLETLREQSERVTLTSRAFFNDQLGPWLEQLCKLFKKDLAIPMNSGAEAVETAIKIARKWGYRNKKIAQDKAEIIVCRDNFHGRTTTVVSFSTEDQYRNEFGPFTPGFTVAEYGDITSLEKAITPNTVGFLVEPIQGEAGVVLPPEGYLKQVAALCKKHNVLMIADEIQTGLCRTGKMLAVDHEDVSPDLLILGKALGGGFYPISAVLGGQETLGLLRPGDHGSTFGGNPLACALSRTALDILVDEKLAERSANMGEKFRSELRKRCSGLVKEVRGKGLLNAIEVVKDAGDARVFSERLLARGILAKDTHGTTVRFAPPLIISESAVDWAVSEIVDCFSKKA